MTENIENKIKVEKTPDNNGLNKKETLSLYGLCAFTVLGYAGLIYGLEKEHDRLREEHPNSSQYRRSNDRDSIYRIFDFLR